MLTSVSFVRLTSSKLSGVHVKTCKDMHYTRCITKLLNDIFWCICLCCLIFSICCRQLENIGEVQHAVFDKSQKFKQIIVASKENVVASLSTTTGAIGRHFSLSVV